MPREIRPEVSKRNKYYISKERYLELKHFCLQYKEWKKELMSIGLTKTVHHSINGSNNNDYIENIVILRDLWSSKIELVERSAKEADEEFYEYLLDAVVNNRSCDYEIMHGMPCGRDKYYLIYRKFFYILSINQNNS